MRVCVTGGAGFLGSVLVPLLNANENITEIVVVDNLMYRQNSPLGWGSLSKVKFHCLDVRNHYELGKLASQSDVLICLAALVGMPCCEKDPELAKAINQDHIQFLVKNLSKNQRILGPMTNSLYGKGQGTVHCNEESPVDPISVYSKTKYEAEKSVIDVGGTSLRLATLFGISSRFRSDLLVHDFVIRAKRDKFLVLFESHFVRNYIHIRDAASAFEMMINKSFGSEESSVRGQVFNLGLSDANLTKMELALKIKEHVPELNIFESEFAKDVDKRNYLVSNSKIEKLGFKAKFSLDDGIRELLQYYPVIEKICNKDFTNL